MEVWNVDLYSLDVRFSFGQIAYDECFSVLGGIITVNTFKPNEKCQRI